MGQGAPGFALDSGFAPVWLWRFRFILSDFLFPMGPEAYGPGVSVGWPPPFAFFSYMLWIVTLAMQAIRCNQERLVSK
jgi:hypothetical protein